MGFNIKRYGIYVNVYTFRELCRPLEKTIAFYENLTYNDKGYTKLRVCG